MNFWPVIDAFLKARAWVGQRLAPYRELHRAVDADIKQARASIQYWPDDRHPS